MMTTSDHAEEPTNLNLADDAALAHLGLTETQIQAIIAERPFRAWGDLKRIEGLDQDRINALKSAGADIGEPGQGPLDDPGSGGSEITAGEIGRA